MKAPIRPLSSLPVRKTLTGKEEINHLAQMSGVTTAFMRKFVREAITVIEAGLLRDGVVKIHHFGTFRLVSSPLHSSAPQVVFQPVKKIRELVIRAFGPTVHTGSRVSLAELIEKHLELPATLPEIKKSAPEEFDIAEVFPELMNELPTRFTFAEKNEINERPKEEFAPGELISELASASPANNGAATLTVAESVKEVQPLLSPAGAELNRLLNPSNYRRRRRFGWYAGAFAIFLLLLLFLLPGQISERPGVGSFSVISTKPRPTAEASSQNKSEKHPIAPVSTTLEKPAPYFAGGTHRVVHGDNFWGLSGNYYRNHFLWPNIYRANTATVKNPNVLELNQQLAVPVLCGPPERLTTEDRRNLAEGYFLLYRYYKTNDPALAPFALWAAVRYDARIKKDYATELNEDDLAFLQAHTVPRQVAER